MLVIIVSHNTTNAEQIDLHHNRFIIHITYFNTASHIQEAYIKWVNIRDCDTGGARLKDYYLKAKTPKQR